MFNPIASDSLIWLPERGLGYFPVRAPKYGEEYFQKYEGYADTEMGKRITKSRIDLVDRHMTGCIVDVGIGCGQFVEMRGLTQPTLGFDVNPVGESWLKSRGLWCDIYNGQVCKALTFWDSLEHIEDIDSAVLRAREFVFVSIPIFNGHEHVLRSKHFKKNEHYWYFTHDGLVLWFAERGFALIESNQIEQGLGREDIGTYAFWRING